MSDWSDDALTAARKAWHELPPTVPMTVIIMRMVDAVEPIIRADERARGDKAVGGFLLEAISQRDAARAEVERLGEIVREQDEHAAWMRQCWKAVAEERDEARADAIVATRERDARVRADEQRGMYARYMVDREAWEAEVRERIADLVQMKFSMTSARSHDSGCVCHLCAINSTVDAAVDFIRGGGSDE